MNLKVGDLMLRRSEVAGPAIFLSGHYRSKGFNLPDVVGNDVVAMMHEALERAGVGQRLHIVALINDSVGTYVSGIFQVSPLLPWAHTGRRTNRCAWQTIAGGVGLKRERCRPGRTPGRLSGLNPQPHRHYPRGYPTPSRLTPPWGFSRGALLPKNEGVGGAPGNLRFPMDSGYRMRQSGACGKGTEQRKEIHAEKRYGRSKTVGMGGTSPWFWYAKWRAMLWQNAAMILFSLINMAGMAEPARYKG